MQYSLGVLNHLTAPNLSSLTACGAVKVSELPDYDLVLNLNQLIGSKKYPRDNQRILITTFIKRLGTAISEYNQGQFFLQEYVDALPVNIKLGTHRKALAHF
jgi:hypothetical protein